MSPHERPEDRTRPRGHPLEVFRRENAAILEVVDRMRDLVAESGGDAAAGPGTDDLVRRWREAMVELRRIEHHYSRKESLLFPYLDRYGIVEPARQMWSLDHRIRRGLRSASARMDSDSPDPHRWIRMARESATPLLELVETMVAAETEGLLPHCAEMFTERDWAEIHRESARFEPCLVEPGVDDEPPDERGDQPRIDPAAGLPIRLPTGVLDARLLDLMLRALPLDLTLTDADDRIVFYSDGPRRAFTRTPAIVGRALVNCHPPAVEAVLERLMDALRSGERDSSESVMQRDGRWYHITYLALRDEEGAFAGCLEVAQDITEIRRMGRDAPLPTYGGEE